MAKNLTRRANNPSDETICAVTALGPLQWQSLQARRMTGVKQRPCGLSCQRSIKLQCLCIVAALHGMLRCTQQHTLIDCLYGRSVCSERKINSLHVRHTPCLCLVGSTCTCAQATPTVSSVHSWQQQ